MLPPLQLLAQDKATLAADSPMGAADRAAHSGFETSLAAFLHRSAALSGTGPHPESLSGAGRTLPPGGNDLPLRNPMPDLAGRMPELSSRPVAANRIGAMPQSPEETTSGPTTPSASLPVPPGGPPITMSGTMAHEHSAQLRTAREIATTPIAPRAVTDGAPLTKTPAVNTLPPIEPEQLTAQTAATGERLRQPIPVGRILPLPGPGTSCGTSPEPVSIAKVADTIQPGAAESRLSQQGAPLAVPAAVLRDQKTETARTPLQDASMQAELLDRKSTLPGTAMPPPAPTAIAHTAPASASIVSAPAVPQALPLLNPIDLPPGADGWSDTLGDRVVMMAGNKIQSAEIRLNPADLGPLRVHISVDDGTATVNFHAQHPLTRDAIEQALPRLREMLGDQGLSLGDANVSDHGVPHDQAEPDRHSNPSGTIAADNASMGIATDSLSKPTKSLASAGMIDLFA